MKSYNFHLIRHGSTDANKLGFYCGSGIDISLNEDAYADFENMKKSGKIYPYADAVYTGPLKRTIETAYLIYPDIDQIIIPDLTELSFGPFEGKSLYELRDNEDYKKWIANPNQYKVSGVEEAQAFLDRISKAFARIVIESMKNGTQSTAIITHADVISYLLAALAYPKGTPYDWQTNPFEGFTVNAMPSIFMREPVVEVISRI